MPPPERRSKVVRQAEISDRLSKELDGLPGMLRRWGNTALTCILIVAAVLLLIRWRIASVEQGKLGVLNALSNARNYVIELRPENLKRYPPDYLARVRTDITSHARGEIADVLNNTDDPKLKAQALVTRGDLNWQLANFPELPGAATQPALQSPETREELLKKAADEYNTVLKTDAYAKDHDARTSARFGLAAVAENQSDWDTAKRELQAIVNDPETTPVLVQQAKDDLSKLPDLEKPLYMAPATQQIAEIPATAPTTERAALPPTSAPTLK
jgi:hypothetical protein